MEISCRKWGNAIGRAAVRSVSSPAAFVALFLLVFGSAPARAQEQLMFPAIQNVQEVLIQKIRNERVRLDIAVWLLVDGELVQAVIDKHQSGVPVRVIGDRVSIFEGDPNTRASFLQLANAGVPIRLRYRPTSFPEILHWKSAIFVGQNTVEFGSANFTTFELKPASTTDFKDETALFSSDATLVRAFMTMFDQMWADTTTFLDWSSAYERETGTAWTRPMNISTVRLEPDYPTNLPGMVWSQGPDLLTRMIAEIDAETRGIDFVSYRLTAPELTDALIRRHRAGVPVRVFIEPTQYRNPGYPEYWLVGAMVDRLWAAGVPVKQRTHQGLTHMKTLITSRVALIASSNFTRYWQRDHNYFVDAGTSPQTYFAMKDRFSAMWNDAANYTNFQPLRPDFVEGQSPAASATNVSTSPALVWRRAPWAVAFDVFFGVDPANLPLVRRVNAVVTEDPPDTYSVLPFQTLQPSTRYYWRIVARTYATDLNPALTTSSELYTFVTGATVTPVTPGAAPSSSCLTVSPVAGWVCVNGGWVPPSHPLAIAALAGPPVPPSLPTAPSGTVDVAPATCVTVKPVATWVCVNGGWVPPDSPLAAGASVPAPPPVAPIAVPVAPSTGSCSTPDPFVAMGGGVCTAGGWVPKGHPLAGGGG
jgi:phosphatidylserine/phosphatidylglycerophosphate/cardiolipin synthase-like enzyme